MITKNNISQKISDNSSENFVQVFPNPFGNNFNLYLHNFKASKVYLKIYDAKGSLIVTESLSVNGSLYKEINLQSFPKGIYILNLQTDDGFKFVKKILKQ